MRRKRLATVLTAAALAVAFPAFPASVKPGPQAAGTLQIKGSDTMVNLGQAWAEAFNALHPEANIAVTGGGSGTGIAALFSRTCDIAESSRSLAEKEIAQAKTSGLSIQEEIVALDGIVVVIHPSNPIDRLTMGQLREIFLGNIRNWKVLGGPDRPIVLLSREVNSGTHIFFKEHVLRKGKSKGPEEFSPRALMMPSSYAIAEEVAGNENAVGYYGLGYISPRQRTVSVAADEKSPFIAPTIETIRTGTYPISRPLFLFAAAPLKGLVKSFFDFALSKEGQEIVVRTDFVPIK
jgi:phosphate transport system substrate-binding protein